MRAVRALGNLIVALWLVLALAVARIAPIALLMVWVGLPYRVAGTVVAIPVVVLVVHTAVAARSMVQDRSARLHQPDEDYLLAVAAAARDRGVPVPTVVHGDVYPPGPPVAIRGWRWCFVVTAPGLDPVRLLESVSPDLQDGTARVRTLLWSFTQAVTDCRTALRMLTTPFNRSTRTDTRWYLAPLLVLLPGVLVGYAIAWAVGALTALVLPRRLRATGRAPRSADARLDPGAVDPAIPQVGPGTPGLRRIPPLGQVDDLIGSMARIIVALLVTFLAAYQGPGILPAERIVWPWERGPVQAEVLQVQHIPSDDGLLGYLGVRHNSTWRPTVALPDGSEVRLAAGSTEVAAGDQIPVVSWQGDRGDQYRHLHQTSPMRYTVMTVMMVLVAFGLSRPFAGSHFPVLSLLGTRHLAQVDYDQRLLTGRRHRRRRPRYLFGNKIFEDL